LLSQFLGITIPHACSSYANFFKSYICWHKVTISVKPDHPRKRRGNPGRPYADVLLAHLEFEFVSWHFGPTKTVAWLDTEFARNPDGTRRTSADRIQVFEHARDRGKPLPHDVIARLSEQPGLALLQHIADSLLWRLLTAPPSTRREAYEIVSICLQRLNLVRLPTALEDRWLLGKWRREPRVDGKLAWRDQDSEVLAQLDRVIANFHANLDLVALLGALYREACFDFQPEAATHLGTIFWARLFDFLSRPGLEKVSEELQAYAVNRIIYDLGPEDSRQEFNKRNTDRVPGDAIGLIIRADDPDMQLLTLGTVGDCRSA
jgi:hypothetical protein